MQSIYSITKNLQGDDRIHMSDDLFKMLIILRANQKELPDRFKLDWRKLKDAGIDRDIIQDMKVSAEELADEA